MDAAARELLEETGQAGLALAGPIHRRVVDFLDHGRPVHQIEHYFAARTSDLTLSVRGWTGLERQAVIGWRWWTADELAAAGVRYFPDELAALVSRAGTLV